MISEVRVKIILPFIFACMFLASNFTFAQITTSSRPFAIDANSGLQRHVGIFESTVGENIIGLYIINNDSFSHTNVQVSIVPPSESGITMILGTTIVKELSPNVPTLITLLADFTNVLPDKYDIDVIFKSDQANVTSKKERIFTATTVLKESDPKFGNRPTIKVSIPEGTMTVDVEKLYDGNDWLTRWSPKKETMILEHTIPFEGQIGPVPYSDWVWKVAGGIGKGLVAFTSGWYIAEGIDKGDCIKTAAATGGALMTIAETATWSDDADPFKRGQENTFPHQGEKTFKEVAIVSTNYLDNPTSGNNFKMLTSWVYTRYTIDENMVEHTYSYSITDEVLTNIHYGGKHTLKTNASTYQSGDTVFLTARIMKGDKNLSFIGDEAYLVTLIQGGPELSEFVILTDDGQHSDEKAKDGIYSGTWTIPQSWTSGSLPLVLFAQENLFGFNEFGSLVLNSFSATRINIVNDSLNVSSNRNSQKSVCNCLIPSLILLNNFLSDLDRNNHIQLTWKTGAEIHNAGFKIWRGIKNGIGHYEPTLLREFSNSKLVNSEPNEDCSTKIQGQLKEINPNQNQKLIFAIGNSTESTCYSFTDTSNLSDGTYYYLLEDIGDNGKSTFHCDQIDAVTVGQGPAINLESAINYCKEVTGSNN